jgi:hypothetical protein
LLLSLRKRFHVSDHGGNGHPGKTDSMRCTQRRGTYRAADRDNSPGVSGPNGILNIDLLILPKQIQNIIQLCECLKMKNRGPRHNAHRRRDKVPRQRHDAVSEETNSMGEDLKPMFEVPDPTVFDCKPNSNSRNMVRFAEVIAI